MRHNRRFVVGILLLAALSVVGCKKSGDDGNSGSRKDDAGKKGEPTPNPVEGAMGQLALAVKPVAAHGTFLSAQVAANASTATHAGSLAIGESAGLLDAWNRPSEAFSLTSAGDYTVPAISATSIASGSPEEMVIKVKRIELMSGNPKNAVAFESASGADLVIANGAVDLSALATVADDGTVNFGVAAGTYTGVRLTLAHRAQIKGCVAMKFGCIPVTGTGQDCTHDPADDIPGNLGGGQTSTSDHLYCTKTAKSPLSGIKAQNSDFESSFASPSPEMMEFSLNGPAGIVDDRDTFIDYPLPAAVQISEGDATPLRLTLLLDLNRMLRYFNRGRQDQGDYKDMAYFFSNTISGSSYVFVGEPGRIYGYEMTARACNQTQGGYNSTSHTCVSNGSPSAVPFWMTLVTAPSGMPLVSLFMPDDDNALTITKGGSGDVGRCPLDGNTDWVRLDNGGTTASIYFAMCLNFHTPVITGNWAHLGAFPVDLEGTAVGASVSGVTLNSTQDAAQSPPPIQIYDGVVDVTRRL